VLWSLRGILREPMNATDRLIARVDNALRTLSRGRAHAARPNPAAAACWPTSCLDDERRLAGALMRVNHVGEVCAQALYQAQALTARTDALAPARWTARRAKKATTWPGRRSG
jgi:ubiquinone biosynthesis monooxygenase Coq7